MVDLVVMEDQTRHIRPPVVEAVGEADMGPEVEAVAAMGLTLAAAMIVERQEEMETKVLGVALVEKHQTQQTDMVGTVQTAS